MKNSLPLFHFKYLYTLAYLLILFFACVKTPSASDKTDKWETTPWLEAFGHTLPHENPALCMQLLRDSVKSLSDQQWLCEGIMFNAFETQVKDVYMAHLDNFEGLAKGRFKVWGQSTEVFAAKVDMFRGNKYREQMQFDSALFFLNKSLKVFEAHKDTTFVYEALYRIAATHSRQANYIAAIEVTLQNMNFIRKNDTINRVRGLSALARCYNKSGDTDKAKYIQYEAMRLAETTNDTFLIADISEELSMYLAQLGQGDSALWAVKKSLNLINIKENMERLDITYLHAGLAYKVLNDFTQALDYSQKAFYLSDSMQDKGYKLAGIKQIADCYLLMGDGPNAHKYYAKALNFLDSIEKTDVKMQIYDSLTVLSFQERNDVEGLRRLRASKAYAKTQFSKERQQIVENMNIRYETAQRKEQINTLNNDKKTLQLQLLLGVLFFVSALGFSSLFIYRNRQRQTLINKENELLIAKEQATQLELTANQQQLDAFTANILAKNQLISDLEGRISALSVPTDSTPINDGDDNAADSDDNDNEENREKLANMKILTDADWKLYLTYFTQVHKDFMVRVDRDLQDLSAAELRLFMLLKQGFDSKNMADVLGISMAGIKKSRHRLRKRLNLNEEDNLEAFVQAF